MNLLKGGKGDTLSPKHVNPDQLRKGIKIEMEHTNDPKIAREIALDHLSEYEFYYEELEKMEKKFDLKEAVTKAMIREMQDAANKQSIHIFFKDTIDDIVRRFMEKYADDTKVSSLEGDIFDIWQDAFDEATYATARLIQSAKQKSNMR